MWIILMYLKGVTWRNYVIQLVMSHIIQAWRVRPNFIIKTKNYDKLINIGNWVSTNLKEISIFRATTTWRTKLVLYDMVHALDVTVLNM